MFNLCHGFEPKSLRLSKIFDLNYFCLKTDGSRPFPLLVRVKHSDFTFLSSSQIQLAYLILAQRLGVVETGIVSLCCSL